MMGSPTSNRPQHYPYRPNGFDDMDPFSMQGIIEEQRLQEQESATYVARSKLPLRIRNLLSQKRDGIPRVITFVSVLGKAAAEDDNSGDLSHIGMVIEVLHDDEGFEPRRNHQRRRSKSFDTEICHRDYDQGSFNTSMSSIQTHSRPSLNKMTLTEFIPKDSIHSKEQFKARHHTNHQTQSREYCDGSVSSSPTSYPHSLHSSAISTLHNSISQQSVASRYVSPCHDLTRFGAKAMESSIRATFTSTERWPLRRKSKPSATLLSVPSHSEAFTPRPAGTVFTVALCHWA